MVVEEKFEGEDSFKCEVCGFHYIERELAEKCEEACRDGHCKESITRKSFERSD
ncbi:MAG: hypothetical protein ABEJ95_03065 [Candidatus Nanohalobium sp.]